MYYLKKRQMEELMKQVLLYHFAMTIFFVTCDNAEEFIKDAKFMDSIELENLMEKGNKQELRNRMVTFLATRVSNIRHELNMENMEQNFLTYFECAFTGWKPVLEDVYKTWCPNSYYLPLLADKEVPKIPDDIVDLNSTYDQWFDDYLSKKMYGPRRGTKSLTKNTRIRINLWQFYKNWYILVNADSPTLFAKQLREKLSNHKENFPFFYKDKDIQVRFAACIARSFLLVCTACHRVMQDLRDHFKAHPRDSFTDKLFELVPYWHLSEETIIYINILRSTLSSVSPKSLGKCIGGDISCFPARNKRNDTVCLPYLFSKECGRVDLTSHSQAYSFSFVTKKQNYTTYSN